MQPDGSIIADLPITPRRIADYALIGDCETAALVGCDGSIDWLCWPRFDSGACFAALLGGPEHGRWFIAPKDRAPRITRRYIDGSLILVTTFETKSGIVELVDFMPPHDGSADLVRLVRGVRGHVDLRTEFILRFDYGSIVPWVERLDGEGLRAIAGPEMAVLRTSVSLHGQDFTTVGEFAVGAGDVVPFVLSYGPSQLQPPKGVDPERALQETEAFWRAWSDRCATAGNWSEPVKRSLTVLKGLTYAPTGGIVAAPTTSLPEQAGGVRNWDYRYCWLRDATFTLLALGTAGYYEEARDWRDWLLRAVAGRPDKLQIMYGLGGERRLPEWEVPWLSGFDGARPVRIGNAAATQLQLDVYGEIADAMFQAHQHGLPPVDRWSAIRRGFLDHLETAWRKPDEGIWEVRGPPQHLTHSKVMAWVAFDRAVRWVDQLGVVAPIDHWCEVRDAIHADVCRNGFNSKLDTFVQAYGSEILDASLLLLPIVGFLPPSDPRILGTLRAIERRLLVDGLVFRYKTGETEDGLPPGENAFLACSFWFVDNLILQGRIAEAQSMFERLLALRNDVGLLAEEYDPRTGRLMGNFPQAFSHVSLVNTAYNLTRYKGPSEERADQKAAED
ncbi:putative glycoside hydrolase, family 15 [Hyphomicrobium denitrificans 1NES1]|uniref:Trehalase n=1 Tax=Hyphomicrobium denitrificans 1NES1 TaxID=670307 RepID=N0B409_9HYPH|nr:glycoside hydrolase family 15 protein [Hyphomicrobium denitrificans]AGK56927.1 putative glycoside hydrolase, family 15 [Hyphomicrobium denitrificans 1NES1]